MGLKLIPFFGSLVGTPLPNPDKSPKAITKLAKHSHVLVYGAIEAHSMGEKGTCIASNKTIAAETGLSTSRVASIISELSSAEWVRVKIDERGARLYIHPLMTLATHGNPPLPHMATPLATHGNIDNNRYNNREKSHTSASQTDTASSSHPLPAPSSEGTSVDPNEASAARAAHLEKVFNALVIILHGKQKILYTQKRKSHLNARLQNFKPSQLVEAARNLMQDPWNTGANPQNKKYADFDFLTRSDEQVEKWLNTKPVNKPKSVF